MTENSNDNAVTDNDTTYFKRPVMKRIDSESIAAYFNTPPKTPLTADEITRISQTISSDRRLRDLNKMIEDFIRIQEGLNDFCGLNSSDKKALNILYQAREAFRETHQKGKYNGAAIKSFIKNERLIVPYTKTIQWWQHNSKALNKLSLWEELSQLLNERNKHESSQSIQEKQYQLINIKNAWKNQQLFALIASDDLSMFYEDFICVLEDSINTLLINRSKYHEKMIIYLQHLLYLINAIKLQALHAMLYRLQSIDYYKSLDTDDILSMTLDKIASITHVDLRANGIKPDKRTNLTNDTIKKYHQHIEAFLQKNINEKPIHDDFMQLNTVKTPPQWLSEAKSDKLIYQLIHEPAIVFMANSFLDLLLTVKQETTIDDNTITKDAFEKTTSDIQQLKKMVEMGLDTYQRVTGKSIDNSYDSISLQLLEWRNRYQRLESQIDANLKILIDYKMSAAIASSLTAPDVFQTNIESLAQYIHNASKFYRAFKQSPYIAEGDVVLAIASEILSLLSKGEFLNERQQLAIIQLLSNFYPNITPAAVEKIKDNLSKLSKKVTDTAAESDGYLLHLIIHMIESPWLDKSTIQEALQRHRHISKQHHEIWINNKNINSASAQDEYSSNLMQYANNVSNKLIRMSQSINLETFDDHIADPIMSEIIQINHNIIQDKSLKVQLNEIVAQYQSNIFNKLNNTFAIKQYLYHVSTGKINLVRLSNAIRSIQTFFIDDRHSSLLIKTIQQAVVSLTKKYLLDCIKKDSEPDLNYINQINNISGIKVFHQLRNDSDVTMMIHSYIESYDGTSTALSNIIIELVEHTSDAAYEYTKRRLEYIKSSNNIMSTDYQLIQFAEKNTSVKPLLDGYKQYYSSPISIVSKNRSALWNRKQAMLIELFGTNEAVFAYRFKRIRELLSQTALNSTNENEQEAYVSSFINAINMNRLYNGKIVNPTETLSDRVTLMEFIRLAGKQLGWHIFIEKIIQLTANYSDLRHYHTDCLYRMIDQRQAMEGHWLGRSLSQMTDKEEFEEFFGSSNINGLLSRLNTLLDNVASISQLEYAKPIADNDLTTFNTLASIIKPLLPFYLAFTKDGANTAIANNFNAISDKVHLHYALYTNSITDSISDTSITRLEKELLQAIKRLSKNDLITSHSLHEFLDYCTTQLFKDMKNAYQNGIALTLKDLMSLNCLLESIYSTSMKMKLLKANNREIKANPYWLTLINHFDEPSTLNMLEDKILDPSTSEQFSTDFLRFIVFSKQLHEIKTMTVKRVYMAIFSESDIHLSLTHENLSMKALFVQRPFTADELLRLWNTILNKLKNSELPTYYRSSYISLLKSTATIVSHEILKQSQNNPALLAQFITTCEHLPTAFINSQTSSTPNIWMQSPVNNTNSNQQPMIIKKAIALSLLQHIESFVVSKITPRGLNTFREACNDPIFYQQFRQPDAAAPTVKQLFNLHDEADALIVSHMIQIYHKINVVMLNHSRFSDISQKIQSLLSHAETHANLSANQAYLSFLRSVFALSTHAPQKNIRIDAEPKNKNTAISQAAV